ncbi:rhomboid family intramembrane serine protease, partial [Streptococcus sp. DD11]
MKYIYDKKYPVTSGLLILTGLVFAAMFLLKGFGYDSPQTVYEFGAVHALSIIQDPSQLWRLLAAIFVHIGLEHFAINAVTLYFIGRQTEEIFGSRNFFLLYLLSGLMGNLFVFFFSPDSLSAGASTSLFGLFAAIVTLRYVVRNPYIQQLGQTYLTLIVINVIFSFLPG